MVYLDATRPFPFDGEVFDYVFSEHVIEHLEHPSAVSMLHECFRFPKPGGRICISTPDLRVIIGLLSAERTARQNHYIDWAAESSCRRWTTARRYSLLTIFFRAWGHQFLYDRDVLRVTMTRIGFEDIRFYQPGVSDDENLRGIESHGS